MPPVTAEGRVSIKGLDRAEVLAALYNASRTQGAGVLQYVDRPLPLEEARAVLARADSGKAVGFGSIDYLHGRVISVDLTEGDSFDPRLYDRDNGQGAAARAIDQLRESKTPEAPSILRLHDAQMIAAVSRESRIGFDDASRIDALIAGNAEAALVCKALVLHYILQDPDRNREARDFFEGFNPKKDPKVWYKEKHPLEILEKAGMKGEEIAVAFQNAGRNPAAMYLAMALFPDPENIKGLLLSGPYQ